MRTGVFVFALVVFGLLDAFGQEKTIAASVQGETFKYTFKYGFTVDGKQLVSENGVFNCKINKPLTPVNIILSNLKVWEGGAVLNDEEARLSVQLPQGFFLEAGNAPTLKTGGSDVVIRTRFNPRSQTNGQELFNIKIEIARERGKGKLFDKYKTDYAEQGMLLLYQVASNVDLNSQTTQDEKDWGIKTKEMEHFKSMKLPWFQPIKDYMAKGHSQHLDEAKNYLSEYCKEVYDNTNGEEGKLRSFINGFGSDQTLDCSKYGESYAKAKAEIEAIEKKRNAGSVGSSPTTTDPNSPSTNTETINPKLPDAPPPPECKANSDDDKKNWAEAVRVDRIYAYRNYIRLCPQGAHIADANRIIKELETQAATAKKTLEQELAAAGDDCDKKINAIEKYEKTRASEWDAVTSNKAKDIKKKCLDLKPFYVLAKTDNPKFVIILVRHKGQYWDEKNFQITFEHDSIVASNSYYTELGESFAPFEKEIDFTEFRIPKSELENGRHTVKIWSKHFDKTVKDDFSQSDAKPSLRFANVREETMLVRIIGGKPPYLLFYASDGKGYSPQDRKIEVVDRILTLSRAEIKVDNQAIAKGEEFRLQAVQKGKNLFIAEQGGLKFGGSIGDNVWKYVVPLSALLLVLLGAYYWKKVLKHKAAENVTLRKMFNLKKPGQIEEDPDTTTEGTAEPEGAAANPPPPPPKSGIVLTVLQEPAQLEKGVKITRAEAPANWQGKAPTEVLKDPNYLPIDMQEFWASSHVRTILLLHSCAAAIDDAILTEANRRDQMDRQSYYPEIGGFLLGRYNKYTDETFFVTIEKYIPASTSRYNDLDDQSRFEVRLNMENIAAPLEQNPKLVLVGWFHTHPGHGLFLSRKDLDIHESFFKKPFQFAMESDPYSDDHDLAFFTWKKEGQPNNTSDHILPKKWYNWEKVNRWRRQMKRQLEKI